MIRLPIKKLKSGMIIAQSIYNRRGASYLVKGQPITKEYIDRLAKIGIPQVAVTSTNPNFKLQPPEDVVQEKTRIRAIETVYTAYKSVTESGRLDAAALQSVSDGLILDLIARRENLVQLTDIRMHDTYTFAHSVNVAILSAMIGLHSNFSQQDLQLLTLGAMLHDIGKIDTPTDLLNKASRLNDAEYATIKQHPGNGALRIMEMKDQIPKASVLASVAAEHHEHIDGKGYPRGLKEKEIHRFAKIVAIADVYDALTSERPYKRAYTPNVAYNIMVNVTQGQFDPVLLQRFFNNVALYPVGTVLKTIYGYAIVSHCEFGQTQTPTIIAFADLEGHRLKEPRKIDLASTAEGSRAIEIVISDSELRHFIHELDLDPSMYLLEDNASA